MGTMRARTDAELVAAYGASRDEAAFGEIVSRHGPMVYRVCLGLLGDPHEAEDCSQAAFVVLVRKASSLRRSEDLAAWLYGVARHVSLRAAEARANRAKREEKTAMIRQASQEGSKTNDSDLMGLAYRELAGLSAPQRQAVILRHLEGLSEEEATKVAGCPRGTLSRRASEGIARLRERLARRGQVLGAAPLVGLLEAEAKAAISGTLLPSILATSKLAAAGAAAGAAGGTVFALAEGVMRMMFWAKVRTAVVWAVCIFVLVGAGGMLVPNRSAEPVQSPKREDTVWGAAERGLQLGLSAKHGRVPVGQPLELVLHVKNSAKEAVKLPDLMAASYSRGWAWYLVLTREGYPWEIRAYAEKDPEGLWTAWPVPAGQVSSRALSLAGCVFLPGLGEGKGGLADRDRYEARQAAVLDSLPAGQYSVQVRYRNLPLGPRPAGEEPFFFGVPETGKLAVTIEPEGAKGSDDSQAAKGKELVLAATKLAGKGELAQAINTLHKAWILNPKDPQPADLVAEYTQKLEDEQHKSKPEAEAAHDKWVAAEILKLRQQLARSFDAGKYEEAIKAADKIKALNPKEEGIDEIIKECRRRQAQKAT